MQTSTKVDLKGATGPGGQGNVQSSGRTAGEMTRPFQRQEWLGCAIIALCFAGWGLRSVGGYNIIETDAARHAMNGVFLRDLVASGHFTDVLPFARAYYAHLPALSMPYHPPLFPLIEAVFFAIFGVNALAARLAIGLTVFLSGVILFRLAHASNRSLTLAAVSTVTFLCLPEALWLGADVMLEFPALVFTLLAIYCLQGADNEFTMKRALAYALLASAALWTRQQMIFLGAVPFGYFLLLGRWRVFLRAPLWVSAGLFGGSVAALSALSLPFHGAGVNQAIPSAAPHHHNSTYIELLFRNLQFYFDGYPKVVGPAGVLLILALLVTLALRLYDRKVVALYGSWIVSSLAVLMLIRPIATRYLFFTYPALIVLGYAGLMHIVERFSGSRRWAVVAAAILAAIALVQFPYRTQYLHGPEEAARVLAGTDATRILYCGGTDGNFIFNFRAQQKDLRTTIIMGDKLPPSLFAGAALEEFAHDYGIQYIVLEDAQGVLAKRPWVRLMNTPPPSMIAERDVPLTSSDRWNGLLRIYRFTNPSPTPKDYLSMRMFTIGGTMDFKLRK
jgi:hypothetical protein